MSRASRLPKVFAAFSVLCAATFLAPAAGADPAAGTRSAADTINDLTAKGYNVQINWVSGVSSEPLTRCRATAVHNPERSAGTDPSNTTVYVDVSCPNEADDGVWGGIGIEFG